MKSCSKDKLVNKLSLCGQVAEHKSEKIQEHGGDEAWILSALTEEEKTQLDAILSKLQAAWIEDHRANHPKKA